MTACYSRLVMDVDPRAQMAMLAELEQNERAFIEQAARNPSEFTSIAPSGPRSSASATIACSRISSGASKETSAAACPEAERHAREAKLCRR